MTEHQAYDRIFAANGPPPDPVTPTGPAPTPTGRRTISKAPTHSLYLQSKVYRALERIKAERGEVDGGDGGEGPSGPGATAAAGGTEGTVGLGAAQGSSGSAGAGAGAGGPGASS
jgi:import inner membrane translocase subunit TIM16